MENQEKLLTGIKSSLQDDLTSMLQLSVDNMKSVFIRQSNNDGTIPLQRLNDTQKQIDDIILSQFIDSVSGSAYNGVTPISPYSKILNKHILAATLGAVTAQSDILRAHLPVETFNRLQQNRAPYRKLPTFTPFNQWKDKRGYVLSNRIWETALNTRSKLNRFLEYHIRSGTSVIAMSKELEVFLHPTRTLRTNRPYGTSASYDAMRLARTEVSIAHTEMTIYAARHNPFVTGMDWLLSPRHPKTDICDKYATISMSDERVKEPYPLSSFPRVVGDSHPQCLCVNAPYVSDDEDELRKILDEIERKPPPYKLPINVRDFLIGALGTEFLLQINEALNGTE